MDLIDKIDRDIQKIEIFDPVIYSRSSLDLLALDLTDKELRDHFYSFGCKEARIFGATNSTTEFLSMKWLRGRGLEIGAGRYPTPLYGSSVIEIADIAGGEAFGSQSIQHHFSIDSAIPENIIGEFDFVIASHVLEHADGIIRAVSNLLDVVKAGGLVYLVVPDRTYLEDANWMPFFEMTHHEEEYHLPMINNSLHDDLALSYMKANLQLLNPSGNFQFDTEDLAASGGQVTAKELSKLLQSGNADTHRFMFHKHTYDFNGWVSLMLDIKRFLADQFSIAEIRYGMERYDCHFVLRKN